MLNDPVTLMITRVPKPGQEREWERIETEVSRAARAFPGYRSTTVIKPKPGEGRAYRLLVSFDSLASFQRWERSPERHQWLERLAALECEPMTLEHVSGVETWFELPSSEHQPMVPPPRHKMMLASSLGVYLILTPLLYLLGPWLSQFPIYVANLFTVPIISLLLTYAVMPLLSRLLRRWLYLDQS